MTDPSFAVDPRVAAVARRISATRDETMKTPDTPKRLLMLSLLDDLDRALDGKLNMTDEEYDRFLTQLSTGWLAN